MNRHDSKFYALDRKKLEGIEMRLETEYDNDWINLFVDMGDHTISQFNEPEDLVDSRDIRISAELALEIWEMVELKSIMEVKRAEVKARLEFDREYGSY